MPVSRQKVRIFLQVQSFKFGSSLEISSNGHFICFGIGRRNVVSDVQSGVFTTVSGDGIAADKGQLKFSR